MSENGPGEITSIEITAGGKTATLTVPPKVPDENERALSKIREANLQVDRAWLEWDQSKKQTAEYKSAYEAAVAELRAIIHRASTPLPLFDQQPQPEGENAWREVLLVEALQGVPSNILAKLAEAGLTTVGQMADFTQSERLIDVPGIGQAKAEQIEAALESFWARRAAAGQAVSAGDVLDADFEVKS